MSFLLQPTWGAWGMLVHPNLNYCRRRTAAPPSKEYQSQIRHDQIRHDQHSSTEKLYHFSSIYVRLSTATINQAASPFVHDPNQSRKFNILHEHRKNPTPTRSILPDPKSNKLIEKGKTGRSNNLSHLAAPTGVTTVLTTTKQQTMSEPTHTPFFNSHDAQIALLFFNNHYAQIALPFVRDSNQSRQFDTIYEYRKQPALTRIVLPDPTSNKLTEKGKTGPSENLGNLETNTGVTAAVRMNEQPTMNTQTKTKYITVNKKERTWYGKTDKANTYRPMISTD